MRWWSVGVSFQLGEFGLQFFKASLPCSALFTLMVRAVIFWSWTVARLNPRPLGFHGEVRPLDCNKRTSGILHLLDGIVLMVVTLGAAKVSRREPRRLWQCGRR